VKFELDENLDVRLASVFEERGLDVTSVFGERLSGRPDQEVVRVAHGEGRALVTLDLDFSNPDPSSYEEGEEAAS
jgi:predicted nuclease of predicted toxin-antitoxin system